MFVTAKIQPDSLKTLVKSTELGRIIAVWLDEADTNSINKRQEDFSFQKAIQPWEQIREVPTVMGYPVSFRMNMPIIVSTVGKIAIKGSQARAVHAEAYIR